MMLTPQLQSTTQTNPVLMTESPTLFSTWRNQIFTHKYKLVETLKPASTPLKFKTTVKNNNSRVDDYQKHLKTIPNNIKMF